MPRISRLLVALAAAASLTVALAAEPADAAQTRTVTPIAAVRHPASVRLSAAQARTLLIRAARHHRVNPNFVLAVSYWESGWNQAARSKTGAVGLMQVEPYTAAWAGPSLLHRREQPDKPRAKAAPGGGRLSARSAQLVNPPPTPA